MEKEIPLAAIRRASFLLVMKLTRAKLVQMAVANLFVPIAASGGSPENKSACLSNKPPPPEIQSTNPARNVAAKRLNSIIVIVSPLFRLWNGEEAQGEGHYPLSDYIRTPGKKHL